MKYLIGESIMDNEYEIYLAAQKAYIEALVEYEKNIEVYIKERDEYKKAHIAFVTGKKES